MSLTVTNAINRIGRTATLRRVVGPQSFISVTLKAVATNYRPEEMQGGIVQGDRQARISDADIQRRQWPGPPRRGDQLIMDGRTFTVQAVDSLNIGEFTAEHVLQVRGAA